MFGRSRLQVWFWQTWQSRGFLCWPAFPLTRQSGREWRVLHCRLLFGYLSGVWGCLPVQYVCLARLTSAPAGSTWGICETQLQRILVSIGLLGLFLLGLFLMGSTALDKTACHIRASWAIEPPSYKVTIPAYKRKSRIVCSRQSRLQTP